MPDFEHHVISSWEEFNKFALARDLSAPSERRGWLYRGQTNDWDLTTKIERALNSWGIDPQNATAVEHQTIREFRRRMRAPEHQRVHCDTLFCLALMQHHGAPTRLLDCTYSPFVAAAFAMELGVFPCAKSATPPTPVIWCFNGQWCEQETERNAPGGLARCRNDDAKRTDETFIPLYQLGPMVPTPPRRFVKHDNPFHLNERLSTQQGIFLCPADLSASFVDNLKAMNGWDSSANVLKLCLNLNPREAIKFARHLKSMNLGCEALFPGLDGFARSIGQHITHYRDLAEGRAGLGDGA
jgi:FRG domain-containing protein